MAEIIDITPDNVLKESLFCIIDPKNPGFQKKMQWYKQRFDDGLRMNILKNESGKPITFVEFVPTEFAWRPVKGNNYLFVQCVFVGPKKDKSKGYASILLTECEKDAQAQDKLGLASMTSDSSWNNRQTII